MQKILIIIPAALLILTACTHDHTHEQGSEHSHEQNNSGNHYHGLEQVTGGHDDPGHEQVSTSHDDHDHDHEQATLLLTSYSDKFEIYAEAAPLAQGLVADMLVHLTSLSDFKPVTSGKVTAILTAGGITSSQTREAPVRPGIFSFSLQPQQAGEATLRFIVEVPDTPGETKSSSPLTQHTYTTPQTSGTHHTSGSLKDPGTQEEPHSPASGQSTGRKGTPGSTGSAGAYQASTPGQLPGRQEITVITDTIEISDIHVYADPHRALHAAAERHEEHPGSVVFTKEQSWAITFATNQVASRPFGPTLKTVGEVLPARGDDMVLTAQTSGIISFTGSGLYEGRRLRSGEPILEVLGSSLAEENATIRYAQAKNNYERAEADYKRLTGLAEKKIISERELLEARNEYHNIQAVYESLKENFNERGQTVTAPFDSYLHDLYVTNGQYVQAGAPLARAGRNSRMVIRAEVQQKYASLLDNIYSASIVTGDQTHTLEEMGGSVLSRARDVSPRSPLIPVHLQITEHRGLLPGELLDVYLKTRGMEPVLVIPSAALIEEQGNYFVYVQIHPETFEKREVRTGSSDGIYTVVERGLQEGERIVSRGAVMIKATSSTGSIDPHSGHVH